MNRQEALDLLLHHSFQHEDVHHPKSEKGFLGMLRPYQGELIEQNYTDMKMLVEFFADELRQGKTIDREIISAFWGICHLARAWAVDPEGMLRRNDLIEQKDIEKIDLWINQISYAVMMLLDGSDADFNFY